MYNGKIASYQTSAKVSYQASLLEDLGTRATNVDKKSGLESNVDGCSCMSCGCFKSAWTIVLSPAGIAAGMAAFASAAALEIGGG